MSTMSDSIPDSQLYTDFPHLFSGLGFLDELSAQNDPNQSNAGSANPTSEGLSVDEQKVYDRQIRIWGLETQNLMRQSRVLFVGRLNGLGAEICKNLVLSGIGSLTLCDNTPTTPASFLSNFLLSEAHSAVDFASGGKSFGSGLTEGQASLVGLSALNSNVKIHHVQKPTNISSLPSQLDLKSFTIVICSGVDMLDAVYLNHQCRLVGQSENGSTFPANPSNLQENQENQRTQQNPTSSSPVPLFVYTDLHANYGLGFFDLNVQHHYVEPKKEAVVGRSRAAAERANTSKKEPGTRFLSRSVSLGTSLSLIGIPIDEMMKQKENNGRDLLPITILEESSLKASLVKISALNTANVIYQSGSYVAVAGNDNMGEIVRKNQHNAQSDKKEITNEKRTENENENQNHHCLSELYQPIDSLEAPRAARRSLKHSHIVNYFLSHFRCPGDETIDKANFFPKDLLKNGLPLPSSGSSSQSSIPGQVSETGATGVTNGVELSGFAAVLGGFVSQEIIKLFQHKPQVATHYNWFNLDMATVGTCEAARII